MMKHLLISVLLFLLLPLSSFSQNHSSFPVDIISGPLPQAFMVEGRQRLVYELHITNYAPWPIELTGLHITGDSDKPLASFDTGALKKMMVPVENILVPSTDSSLNVRMIGVGHAAIIFLEISMDAGTKIPNMLGHKFSFLTSGSKGEHRLRTFPGPAVTVIQEPVAILAAPVHGKNWVAFNSYGSESHRRSYNPANGRIRIAERYAIDWMCLGKDGTEFKKDTKSNSNFYDYGAEIASVADARVSAVVDSFDDNNGSSERSSRAITLDNIVGNYIILDLGHDRFAIYAHLQKGSIKVKTGDKVKTGQMIASLGNSGNSDAPHLHFQLMDANSPLGSEGIPYVLDTFTQVGVITDAAYVDEGKAWRPNTNEKPVTHKKEFPIDNAVVNFP